MRENSLSVYNSQNMDGLMNFVMTNLNEMSKIMLILTEGKTSEFDINLMLNALNVKKLQTAVVTNNLKLAELCLLAGVSPNGLPDCNILSENIRLYHIMDDAWEAGWHGCFLGMAIRLKFSDMRKLLLEYGANPSGEADLGHLGYPLMSAIEMEDAEAVEDLLLKGAKQNVWRQKQDSNVVLVTPLYRALEIYYEKKFHKTGELQALLKEEMFPLRQNEVHNPKMNNNGVMSNSLLLQNKEELLKQYMLPNAAKTNVLSLSTGENSYHQFASNSQMAIQEYQGQQQSIYQNIMESEDFLKLPAISKIIYMLIHNDPQSVYGERLAYAISYNTMNRYHKIMGNDPLPKERWNCLVPCVRNGDLDMVKFLMFKGAKLRSIPDRNWRIEHRNCLVLDEVSEAIETGNVKMLAYFLEQGAFVRYEYVTMKGEVLNFSRGLCHAAIRQDNVDMVALLLKYGASFDDYISVSEVLDEYRKIFDFDLKTCSPQVWLTMKEKDGFEKRYQLIQKALGIEKALEQQKLIKEEQKRIEKAQKLLEEQNRLLLENRNQQMLEAVKNLPLESKLNPVGEDFLLIQQLAIAGYLYQAAKEETKEVVKAWIPRFKYVVSSEEQKKLASLIKNTRKTRQK